MMAVKGTGYGMGADTRSHAFEPPGLGLATAYGIIEQSGGNIYVLSEPGRGTTVTIYFPRTDEPAGEIEQPQAAARTPDGSETILVVEDDDAVRKMTQMFLTIRGYKALEARNADEALQIVTRDCGSINLVVKRRGHARNQGTRTGRANCRDLRRAGGSLHVRLHGRCRR
jgi:two-component system, cell cycle sensor histidine kinase and response regulator CckA